MRTTALAIGTLSLGLLGLWTAAASAQQPTRTWVSGLGDDANPCSRTQPCKTFAGAISKTAAGGEIDALDPGGFGSAVIINKAITIDGGSGQVASVFACGIFGFSIGAGANDIVRLRNISIQGCKDTGGGGNSGVVFERGAALHIEHLTIRNFGTDGINLVPNQATASRLHVVDTIVSDNIAAGIAVTPAGGGLVKVEISKVRMNNNAAGLKVDGAASSANVGVTDSEASNNSNNGVNALNGAVVQLNRVGISGNGINGIQANGSGAVVFVGSSVITGNAKAGNGINGGSVQTYGNNQVDGNADNGTFAGPISLR